MNQSARWIAIPMPATTAIATSTGDRQLSADAERLQRDRHRGDARDEQRPRTADTRSATTPPRIVPTPNAADDDRPRAARRSSAPSRPAGRARTRDVDAQLPMPKKTIVVQIQRLPPELVPALAQLGEERLAARRCRRAAGSDTRSIRSAAAPKLAASTSSAPPGLPDRDEHAAERRAEHAEDRAAEPEQRIRLLQPHRADDQPGSAPARSGSRSRRRARRRAPARRASTPSRDR